jgi:hypothetical protein
LRFRILDFRFGEKEKKSKILYSGKKEKEKKRIRFWIRGKKRGER